jgi:hypothetical protein
MSEHRLQEIVIERPRRGWRISLKKRTGFKKQLLKITQEASTDGLFRPYLIKPRHPSKYFADHLAPLRNYLHSNVGQPWNNVYSNLCHRLDSRTVTGQHVIGHLWDYVERHVEYRDGILYRKASWRKAQPLESHYHDQYYIDPETGILCVLARNQARATRKFQPKPTATETVVLDQWHEYHCLAGIWYLITFAKLPTHQGTVFDRLEGMIHLTPQARISKSRYAIHKRQCNKKEIRALRSKLLSDPKTR